MQPPRPENLVMPAQDAIDRPLDYAGNRYLHALARHDFSSARLVEAIDKRRADVNVINNDGYSPLRYAIESGSAETVAALMRRGARPVYETGKGRQYNAVTAAILRGSPEILKAVLENGGAPYVNAPGLDSRGDSETAPALTLAVQKYNYSLIAPLAAAGAALNPVSDSSGLTPLAHAASLDAPSAVTALWRAGADINAPCRDGRTALHLAVAMQDHRTAMLDTLLGLGAETERRDAQGRTALMAAVEGNNPRMVQRLLAAGAKIDARNDRRDGETPLMAAARLGYADIAGHLLKGGADVLLCDRFNRTAAKIAQDNPHTNRSSYDPMTGHAAPQPKTMLIEAEQKAAARAFEKQYRAARKKHGP